MGDESIGKKGREEETWGGERESLEDFNRRGERRLRAIQKGKGRLDPESSPDGKVPREYRGGGERGTASSLAQRTTTT